MSELIESTGPLIASIYSQAHPGEPIDLGRVAVRFDHNGEAYEAVAAVALRFVPDSRLEFACQLNEESFLLALHLATTPGTDVKVTLPDLGISLDVLYSRVSGASREIIFTPRTQNVVVKSSSGGLTSAVFHLFNLPDFSGPNDYILITGDAPSQGRKHCGRVVLTFDGWDITIAATDRTGSLTEALQADGGYCLTHMGRITLANGASFTSEELDDTLNCLQYFLSFALGRWLGIALPIGFDGEGNRAFERWSVGWAAAGAWGGSSSWFDRRHSELLSQVYPGFVSLWKSELWHRPLTLALYWYLGANDRGVGIGPDTGLVLSQTALELLAWTSCVLDQQMISPVAFRPRGLSAADKLRLLASSLNIPKGIPTNLSALQEGPVLPGGRSKPWPDGMQAITDIRNSLVHPDSQAVLPDNAYYEAWKLSLWYIDLVILRLCRHSGQYANRLTQRSVGDVESVPWATVQSTTI